MSSDPPELGKGLFGYRKSAVNQIIADRDIMLRQAEGRVRAAESKVADLEGEIAAMRERNVRMDEQLDRLRTQVESLSTSKPAGATAEEQASPAPQEDDGWDVSWSAGQAPWDDEPISPVIELAHEPAEPDKEVPAMDVESADTPTNEPVSPGPTAAQDTPSTESPAEPARDDVFDESDSLVWGTTVPERDAGRPQTPEEDERIPSSQGSRPIWMDAESEDEDDAPAPPSSALDELMYQTDEYTYGGHGSDIHHTDQPPSDESEAPSAIDGSDQAVGMEESAMGEATPEPEGTSPTTGAAEQTAPAGPPSEAAARSVSPETSEITNRFLTEELSGILAAAEESAARIVERARATTQHQIAQSNRLWREVQAEVSRFASWREEVEPVIHTVRDKVENVRTHIEEAPERIRQALAPMAESISSIDADLAELAAACSPPLLLTPGGLQADDMEPTSWSVRTPEMVEEDADAMEDVDHAGAFDHDQERDDSGHLSAG